MLKGQNYNHPSKGSTTRCEPIRRVQDIKAIKTLLADKPRDLCLFVFGINTNLRASDLVALEVGHVMDAKTMQEFLITEIKTMKPRNVTLNVNCIAALDAWRPNHPNWTANMPLFTGQRGGGLTVPYVSRLVKRWCNQINLRGNYASHTMRKTFGYHQRVTFGVGLPELMVAFNHQSQRQTLDYLCVQEEEVKNIFANKI